MPRASASSALLALAAVLTCADIADAQGARPVKVAVLAPRGKQSAATKWAAVAEYLNAKIPGTRFVIMPVDLTELEAAVGDPQVQFVYTNPATYVMLEHRHGTTRMLTALPLGPRAETYSQFGAAIFARRDSGLRTLKDLVGKRLAVVEPRSFGGYLMVAYELRVQGIKDTDLAGIVPLGFPHQLVVEAVMRGDFEAGVVRTDILERMAKEGRLSLDDVVVLDEKHHPGFGYRVSTPLYPEWAFASTAGADPALTREVAHALLELERENPAARSIELAGFTVPLDYTPVHTVLRELRAPPYENWGARESLAQILQRYWRELAGVVGAALLFVAGWWLRASRRRVRELTARQAELLTLNATVERRVQERTVELEQSREQYRALVEGTRAVPWEMDPRAHRFTYVGPQAELLLGWPAAAWLEQDFLASRLQAAGAMEALENDFDLKLRRADGGWSWVRCVRGEARAGSDGVRVSGLLIDVTERYQLEFELRQAQKLESVGRLAAGIAHEINTPLQFVSDSVHFLREGYREVCQLIELYQALRGAAAEGRPLAEALAAVRAAEEEAGVAELLVDLANAVDLTAEGLGRVAGIVRSMKQFAHPDQAHQVPVDLNQALGDTLMITRNEYKLVAEVTTDFGKLPPVQCYAGELNQAFLNIIVNAAHAVGEAGCGVGGEKKGEIHVSTRLVGDRIKIAVRDTGTGIPEAIREKIFDPFFTTKALGKGTGQGLAIVRSIVVEKHGGTIEVESSPGAGTTFTISLPLTRPAAAAQAHPSSTAGRAKPSGPQGVVA